MYIYIYFIIYIYYIYSSFAVYMMQGLGLGLVLGLEFREASRRQGCFPDTFLGGGKSQTRQEPSQACPSSPGTSMQQNRSRKFM